MTVAPAAALAAKPRHAAAPPSPKPAFARQRAALAGCDVAAGWRPQLVVTRLGGLTTRLSPAERGEVHLSTPALASPTVASPVTGPAEPHIHIAAALREQSRATELRRTVADRSLAPRPAAQAEAPGQSARRRWASRQSEISPLALLQSAAALQPAALQPGALQPWAPPSSVL